MTTTTEQFIVPKMTFKGHSRSPAMSSFVRLSGLSITVGYTSLQTKIADTSLKVDQGHSNDTIGQCRIMACLEIWVRGSFNVTENGTIR